MDVERLVRQYTVSIGKRLYVIAVVEVLFTKEAIICGKNKRGSKMKPIIPYQPLLLKMQANITKHVPTI